MQERLEELHSTIVSKLKAIEALEKTQEWATLRETIFDTELESIDRRLMVEVKSSEVNLVNVYRLQGERNLARRLCDFPKMVEDLKRQLQDINIRINA